MINKQQKIQPPTDDLFISSSCDEIHNKVCVVCNCNEVNDSVEAWVIKDVGVSLICPNCKEEVYRFYFTDGSK